MISIGKLKDKVEKLLAEDDLNGALELIRSYVDRLITEPICAGKGFGSVELDRLCLKIGLINIKKLNHEQEKSDDLNADGKIIYVVSKLQRSGGHSRLIQDFIKFQPRKKHIILSTEIAGSSDWSYFEELYGKFDNIEFLKSPRLNLGKKLIWVQDKLIQLNGGVVFLLNHHQDSVAVAALTPNLCAKGKFFHHGDHHLSLGVHLDHLEHIDLHPMGYHYCRDELGINNKYLPLTIEDRCYSFGAEKKSKKNELITATAAGFNKIEIPYFVSYFEVVAKILENKKFRHLHIGKLTPLGLRKIKQELKKRGIEKERFIYLEWTPSVWKTLQEYNVDLYVASFPHGAGLTLIEAMGAGIPVIMHEHINSRVLSSLELAYPEAFSWRDPKDLLEYLNKIDQEAVNAESAKSRKWYEENHSSKILELYLNNPNAYGIKVPSLSKKYIPKWDEWAGWVEQQFNASEILYKWVYRLVKIIRR